MTRGIRLKQLSDTDLGHLGLPLDVLGAAVHRAMAEDHRPIPAATDGALRRAEIVRAVRGAAEDALSILDAALAQVRR